MRELARVVLAMAILSASMILLTALVVMMG